MIDGATSTPSAALQASTLVLLRDGPLGCELLLIRRHGNSGFMPGATVFPGGKVDAEDGAALVLDSVDCASEIGSTALGAFAVAAIRELHEEAHVLLARGPNGAQPALVQVRELDGYIEAQRMGRRLAARTWHEALGVRGWTVDLAQLALFAHWLTPQIEPRRFDTLFFAAVLPEGQEPALDVHETTDLCWMTPGQALADHRAGGPTLLPPPTAHTVERLEAIVAQGNATAAAVWNHLRQEGCTPRLQPVFVPDSVEGPMIAMPWDPLVPGAADFLRLHGERLRQMTAVLALPGELPHCDRYVLTAARFVRQGAGSV